MTNEIKEFIKDMLISTQSSPEQIAGRLKLERNISLHRKVYIDIYLKIKLMVESYIST